MDSDILWLVLIRLPLKPLFRCKIICKAWNSVISNADFCTVYRRSADLSAGFFYRITGLRRTSYEGGFGFVSGGSINVKEITSPIISALMSTSPAHGNVLASSGSILLCGDYLPGQVNRWTWHYYVCNPLARQWKALPPSPNSERNDAAVSLICREPPPVVVGAGTAGLSYDYEVVRFYTVNNLSDCDEDEDTPFYSYLEAEIYSSSSGEWLTEFISWDVDCNHAEAGHPLVYEGSFLWVDPAGYLATYDLASRKLEELPPPGVRDDWYRLNHVAVDMPIGVGSDHMPGVGSDGELLYYKLDDKGFDVWVYRRDTGTKVRERKWKRQWRVDLVELVERSPAPDVAELLSSLQFELETFTGDSSKVIIITKPVALTYEFESMQFEYLALNKEKYLPSNSWRYAYKMPSWYFQL